MHKTIRFNEEEWKKVESLEKKDFIAVPRVYDLKLTRKIANCKVSLIGHMLASGVFDHKHGLRIQYQIPDYDSLKNFGHNLREFDPNTRRFKGWFETKKGQFS